jgi:hypothetical protein
MRDHRAVQRWDVEAHEQSEQDTFDGKRSYAEGAARSRWYPDAGRCGRFVFPEEVKERLKIRNDDGDGEEEGAALRRASP